MEVYERRSPMPVSAEELFAWHARPGAFERLVPPWQRVKVLDHSAGVADGSRVVLQVQAGPLRGKWTAEHFDVVPGRQFADRQVSGPFKSWEHTHRFIPDGDEASILEDHLEYELPGPSSSASSASATSARATISSVTRRRATRRASRWA